MTGERSEKGSLVIPALRVGDEEIAEGLHARDGLELFGVNEIGVERDRFGFAEKLYEAAVLLDQIIGEHRNTEAALARAIDAQNIIDDEMRNARPLAVARDFDQPARALQVGRHVAAEYQHPMNI